jgi:8-oxo-dGTP diphosphatase
MNMSSAYAEATLVLPIRGRKMWLGRKTRGIGTGTLNGPGGGIEEGETHHQCLVRETETETSVRMDPERLEFVALLDCYNRRPDDSVFQARVWVYITRSWRGKFKASEEMTDWGSYPLDDLPFGKMMPADPVWIPEVVLKNRRVHAEIHYGPGQKYLESEPVIKDLPADMQDN